MSIHDMSEWACLILGFTAFYSSRVEVGGSTNNCATPFFCSCMRRPARQKGQAPFAAPVQVTFLALLVWLLQLWCHRLSTTSSCIHHEQGNVSAWFSGGNSSSNHAVEIECWCAFWEFFFGTTSAWSFFECNEFTCRNLWFWWCRS